MLERVFVDTLHAHCPFARRPHARPRAAMPLIAAPSYVHATPPCCRLDVHASLTSTEMSRASVSRRASAAEKIVFYVTPRRRRQTRSE